jgi:hypothetical protein
VRANDEEEADSITSIDRIALCILLSISIPKWFGDFKAKHAMHHDEEKRRESVNTMTTRNGTERY